jgi:hypothetical protein
LAVHHDPKYYPDPERFYPERFSDEEKAKRHNYVYLPFGEGPRICIGKFSAKTCYATLHKMFSGIWKKFCAKEQCLLRNYIIYVLPKTLSYDEI